MGRCWARAVLKQGVRSAGRAVVLPWVGHNTFTQEALALIVRSGEGLLRRTRNLCLSTLIEAVRDQTRIVESQSKNGIGGWTEEGTPGGGRRRGNYQRDDKTQSTLNATLPCSRSEQQNPLRCGIHLV